MKKFQLFLTDWRQRLCHTPFAAMLVALLYAAGGFTTTAWGAAGDLDTSFNGTGEVTTVIGSNSQANSMAIQPNDGKIVVTGTNIQGIESNFTLIRYNSDGSLDTTFNSTGVVTTVSQLYSPNSVVIQPADNKIVVAGQCVSPAAFALTRYNTNGSLDTSFGTGGIVTTIIGSSPPYNSANSVAIQPADGKIVAAGQVFATHNVFALARYNTNGSLDSSFGTEGIVTTFFGNGPVAHAVAIQPADGKIVVAGSVSNGTKGVFALARYNTNGSLDSSFGTGGIVTTAAGSDGSVAYSLAIQTDGKIVAAGNAYLGYGYYAFALARYNTNGSLDSSFGSGGIVQTNMGPGDDRALSVAIQSNGRIVAAGFSNNITQNLFALARYNTNGSLDTTFNPAGNIPGTVTTAAGTSGSSVSSVAIQPADGKIVAAGASSSNGTPNVITLVRYLGDGGPTYSLTYNGNSNTGGNVPIDGNAYASGANVTVLGNTGNLVKTGYTFAGWNTKATGTGTHYTGGATFTIGTANVTLYAQWTSSPTYHVTYNGNANTGGSVPTNNTAYTAGQTVTVSGNTGHLTKTGYAFAGWNTKANGTGTHYAGGNTFPMPAANVTLYTQWTVGLVRILETLVGYLDIQSAYDAAVDGDVIQARAVVLPDEEVTFSSASSESVAIKGGFDGGFGSVTGMTNLDGSLTIGGGTTVSIENLIIK